MTPIEYDPKELQEAFMRAWHALSGERPSLAHCNLVTNFLEAGITDARLLWDYVWAVAREIPAPMSIEDDNLDVPHPWWTPDSGVDESALASRLLAILPVESSEAMTDFVKHYQKRNP